MQRTEPTPAAPLHALAPAELSEALRVHPGWESRSKAIVRAFKAKGFREAIELIDQIAGIAQRLDHHPDMLIQSDKLTFTLSTHDAGGVTWRDLELAGAIDEAAAKSGAQPAALKPTANVVA